MNEEIERLLWESQNLGMERLLEFDSQKERDAYVLATQDMFALIEKLGEIGEEYDEEPEKEWDGPSKKEMSKRRIIETRWEARMAQMDDLDDETFRLFMKQQLYGDD